MRATHRVSGPTAVAVALLAAVAGCTDEPTPAGSPTVVTAPSSKPSPSPSPPEPTSDSEIAAAGAEDAVRNYYAVRNELRQDPSIPLTGLEAIAISAELATQQRLFEQERADGQRQVGETRIAVLDVESVNLQAGDSASGDVPSATVAVCYDVGDVDIVDAHGSSIVEPGRPPTGWIRYRVANYDWEADPANGWRVTSSENVEREPCDADG